MSLASLGIGYIMIGGVIAAVVLGLKRRLSIGDAVLIIGLWPLYAPLSFSRADTHHREAEQEAALDADSVEYGSGPGRSS